jgi:hypothetical protein
MGGLMYESCVAQIWMVSTPWIEGVGALEAAHAEDFGKHSETLCARGTTRQLNPKWDPTGELEAAARKRDPDKAAREIDAIPLPAGSKLFFSPDVLKLCIDEAQTEPMPFDKLYEHMAAGDFAFRTNSSALGIARAEADDLVRLVYWEEQKPKKGAPLVPSVVCEGFGAKCAEYGTFNLLTDFESIEAVREHLGKLRLKDPRDSRVANHQRGISITEFNPGTELEAAFTRALVRMREGKVRLPNDPRLLAQLRTVTAVPRAGGKTSIVIPTVNDAHGDLAIACILAIARFEDNAYRRKLKEGAKRLAGQKVEPTMTTREKRDAEAFERMRAMTKMPKAG